MGKREMEAHLVEASLTRGQLVEALDGARTKSLPIALKNSRAALAFNKTAFTNAADSLWVGDPALARTFFHVGLDFSVCGYRSLATPTSESHFAFEGTPRIAGPWNPKLPKNIPSPEVQSGLELEVKSSYFPEGLIDGRLA